MALDARRGPTTVCRQIDAVRTAQGLAKSTTAPLLEAGALPALSLGLYSPELAPLPSDAPHPAVLTGFPWFDSLDGGPSKLSPELVAFLAAGAPPLVISLGSFVPSAAQGFYGNGARIALDLGLRALLITQEDLRIEHPSIMVAPYAPALAGVSADLCRCAPRRRRDDGPSAACRATATDRAVHGRPVRPCPAPHPTGRRPIHIPEGLRHGGRSVAQPIAARRGVRSPGSAYGDGPSTGGRSRHGCARYPSDHSRIRRTRGPEPGT